MSAKNGRRSRAGYEIICTLRTDIICSIYNIESEQYIHLEFRVIFPREDRANKVCKFETRGQVDKRSKRMVVGQYEGCRRKLG